MTDTASSNSTAVRRWTIPETDQVSPVPGYAPFDNGNHPKNDMEQVFAFGCLKISDRNFGSPRLSKELGRPRAVYHIVPNFEMGPPPNGPLKLGSILVSLATAFMPINEGSPILVPPAERMTGLGGDASLESDRNEDAMCGFESLETVYFSTTSDYVMQSMKQDAVRDYMIGSGYKPVYLVTGLKIAHVTALIQKRQQPGIITKWQLDHMLSASVGVRATGFHKNRASMAFDDSSHYVIMAIKVSKIQYNSRFHGARLKNLVVEDYNMGANLV